jgi:hypothetical protein
MVSTAEVPATEVTATFAKSTCVDYRSPKDDFASVGAAFASSGHGFNCRDSGD